MVIIAVLYKSVLIYEMKIYKLFAIIECHDFSIFTWKMEFKINPRVDQNKTSLYRKIQQMGKRNSVKLKLF